MRFLTIFLGISLFSCTFALTVNVSQDKNSVGLYEVLEMDFVHSGTYTNPISDVKIDIDFVHESGDTLHICGFYCEPGLWKARIKPTMVGDWTYSYNFAITGDAASGTGSFTCTQSKNRGFLRRSQVNPFRFQYDDGSNAYLNGFGICHGTHPSGDPSWGSDTVFADKCWEWGGIRWPDGYDWDLCVTRPMSEIVLEPDCGCATPDQFASGNSAAGFNIYRWSNSNCQYRVDIATLDGSYYRFGFNQRLGYYTDTLFRHMESYGFNQIFVPVRTVTQFSQERTVLDNPAPFTDPKMRYWKELYDYCIARWGVYIDIWECFNESRPDDAFYPYAVSYLRSIDPYDHLITTSYHPNNHQLDTLFDLKTHHRYLIQEATQVDNRFWTEYRNEILDTAVKTLPLAWTETGNLRPFSNYHPNRYRVYTWMAFVTQLHMIYWNNSQAVYDTGGGGISNQYIGDEERVYNTIFTNITKDFPIDHASSKISTISNAKIRGYALTSADQMLAYFYYYADRPVTHSGLFNDSGPILSGATVIINVPAGADRAQWIEPTTGAILQDLSVSPGSQSFTIPDIMIDKVLKIGPPTSTVASTRKGAQGLDMGLNCFPNPFNTGVDIILRMRNQELRKNNVEVKIYDITGKLLTSKTKTFHHSLGRKARWDASDNPSGIYLVKVKAGTRVLQKKVTLVK
jgi:hypothetical protein